MGKSWIKLALISGITASVALLLIVVALAGATTPRDRCGDTADASDVGGADKLAAVEYAKGRKGKVSFAVTDSRGHVTASYRPDAVTNSASITKAMILVARLRDLGNEAIPSGEQSQMEAMIKQSDNPSANAIFSRTGRSGVLEVSRSVHMARFRLDTSDPVYVLGNSQITANDQAKFFAKIDELVPDRHRDFAKELLANVQAGRWGLVQANLPGNVLSKAGWRPEANGSYTIVQGAQFGGGRGIAVLTEGNPDEAYGQETVKQVAVKLALNRGGGSNQGGSAGDDSVSPVYAVGDSILEGMSDNLKQRADNRGWKITVDAKRGRTVQEGAQVVRGSQAAKDAKTAIVVLGTNPGGDTNTEAFEDGVRQVTQSLGDAKIYWVEIFSKNNPQNKQRTQLIERTRNVTVIEVRGVALAGDQIHPTAEGYRDLAQIVASSIGEQRETRGEEADTQECDTGGLLGDTAASGSREEIVDIARKEVGYRERAGNCVKYWGGVCEFWCADFASWVWDKAGIKIGRTPHCNGFMDWGQKKTKWKPVTGSPEVGDAILYGSPGNCEHIGLVEKVHGNGMITTIEGNWGDAVTRRGPFKPETTNAYGFASPSKD